MTIEMLGIFVFMITFILFVIYVHTEHQKDFRMAQMRECIKRQAELSEHVLNEIERLRDRL